MLTVLSENQLSDLDSRYWLGGEDRSSDRIQFSKAEYAEAGVDFDRLVAGTLRQAGASGNGSPVLLIPPAASSIAELEQAYAEGIAAAEQMLAVWGAGHHLAG